MALALYRKYRPQTFKEIIGQEHIKVTLEREVASDKTAHAYLFSGPRGTGKTSLARILAKAVNCNGRAGAPTPMGDRASRDIGAQRAPMSSNGVGGEPCNECDGCKAITEGRALDVIEIDAASYTGVDTVRETIIETAKFAPSSFKFKVFIIDEAHMLSTSAWNALLKIIEEPPKHVLFVLATTEVHKVPATIISRCQHFSFHRIAVDDLVKRLELLASKEKIEIAKPVLNTIARQCEGCVRDAESVLEQIFSLGEKEITEDVASLVLPRTSISSVLELIAALKNSDARGGLKTVNDLMEQGIDLARFTEDLLETLRNILLMKVAGDDMAAGLFDAASVKQLRDFTATFDTERVLFLIDKFVKARQELKTASIPQLPLEVAVVEAAGSGGSTALGTQLDQKTENRKQKTELTQEKIHPLSSVSRPLSARDSSVSLQVGQEVGQEAEISLLAIKDKWPELIKKSQEENHSLSFLLSTSQPVEIVGNTLHIGVQYALHRDKLNENKCRVIIEKLLRDLYQVPLMSKGIVVEVPKEENTVVERVLETLGGRVVD